MARVLVLCALSWSMGVFGQAARERAECWSFSYRGESACEVGGALQVARRVPLTVAQTKAWGRRARAFTIDLDSDGALDSVIEAPFGEGKLKTCFVGSTGAVHHCWPGVEEFDGFAFHWFAQLDDTPMLELFKMDGDEDSSDYSVQRLDAETWKPSRLVSVAPFLVTPGDPRATYWGYPWDVRTLRLEKGASPPLLASAEPSCMPEGLEGVPLFFTGVPTQGEPSDVMVPLANASRFRALKDVVGLARWKRPCTARAR